MMKNKKVIILILIVILLLIVNTYAWFIFNSDVNLAINTQVKSWTIEFKEDGQVLENEVELEIDSIYPGMEEQYKEITINNKGEIAAELEYKVTAIELFGERKAIGENCTEEEFKEYMNTLPFIVEVKLDNDLIEVEGKEANCKMTFNWPFGEEGDNSVITKKDEIDTQLGIKAYEFNSLPENKGIPNVRIEMTLIAKQKNS